MILENVKNSPQLFIRSFFKNFDCDETLAEFFYIPLFIHLSAKYLNAF